MNERVKIFSFHDGASEKWVLHMNFITSRSFPPLGQLELCFFFGCLTHIPINYINISNLGMEVVPLNDLVFFLNCTPSTLICGFATIEMVRMAMSHYVTTFWVILASGDFPLTQ